MNIAGQRILLTGASGGIGQHLVKLLATKGAKLALVGSNKQRLSDICTEVSGMGALAVPIVIDLALEGAAEQVITQVRQALGGLDVVINNAGVMDFTLFQHQSPARITQMVGVNITTPILLAQAVLPHFLAQQRGRIVNIGSAFGSIGFPHFATYCATKFAMRGFSEALRRELVDSPVGVTYVAPRATKTSLNNELTTKMLAETNTTMDAPEFVADQIVFAMEQDKKEHFIGQPESFFARLNGLLPRLVDNGLLKNTRIARKYAQSIAQ